MRTGRRRQRSGGPTLLLSAARCYGREMAADAPPEKPPAPLRVLAVCGSLQARSANLTLLRRAAELAPPGVEVRLFEGLRDLPLFDPDLDTAGGAAPEPVRAWRAALASSDSLLIASPEYGHSLPGALKNAIDWLIGSGELEEKVVAVTASTPAPERGRLGLQALLVPLRAVRATVVGGEPIARGPEADAQLASLLQSLADAARSAPPRPEGLP